MLISGYTKMRMVEEKALALFKWMTKSGKVMPNEYNLDCVLRFVESLVL